MIRMEIITTEIPDCLLLRLPVYNDARGTLVKTFHREAFLAAGLHADWPETFYSVSVRGVVRGLHLQLPPHELFKMVSCLQGTVFDVAVDLRRGSPAYGRHLCFTLDAARPETVYLPPGVAHGFMAMSERVLLSYQVSTVHAPQADGGIRWDSLDIPWPEGEKLVSARDAGLPPLAEFETPFVFQGER